MRAIGIEVMHKQAYIHEGHFDSRAQERGAVFGGFRERRTLVVLVGGQASLDGRYQWCFWAHLFGFVGLSLICTRVRTALEQLYRNIAILDCSSTK